MACHHGVVRRLMSCWSIAVGYYRYIIDTDFAGHNFSSVAYFGRLFYSVVFSKSVVLSDSGVFQFSSLVLFCRVLLFFSLL